MKNICPFFSLLLTPFFLFSQTPSCDTLIMQDGKVLAVRIEQLNEREVIFSDCGGTGDKQYMVPMISVLEIRSPTFKKSKNPEKVNEKKRRRLNSIYAAPSLFGDFENIDIYGDVDPLLGAGVFYDREIYSFSEQAQIGISAGLGFVDGAYSSFDGGPMMRLGPKLFLGNERNKFTFELLYFYFNEASNYSYSGLQYGIGYALTGKSGFFFHPKINFLSSFNESEAGDKVKFAEVQLGAGYSF